MFAFNIIIIIFKYCEIQISGKIILKIDINNRNV